MKTILCGVLAGVLLAVTPGAALAGPTVSVRVEGQDRTLLERTVVTLPDTPPPVAGGGCPAGTAAAALEEATKGDWDRQSFVQTILGETHTAVNPDYWSEWLDRGAGYRSGGGVCSDLLNDGDEVLMLVDFFTSSFAPTVFPLDLDDLPRTARAGDSVTVSVVRYVSSGLPGDGVREPVEGATVSGGGATATTDRDGKASLRLEQTGTHTIKATLAGHAPSAGEVIEVTARPDAPPAPADPAPAPDPLPAPVPAPSVPSTPAAPADTAAPRLAIAGLRGRAVIRARRAPRLLRGTVADASGVRSVELSIVRRADRRCQYWSARAERFRRKACNGTQPGFAVGTGPRWSYLLPARLSPGRYYIRVTAVDSVGNRAGTRVVITVR